MVVMILSFANDDTERLFLGESPKKLKIPPPLWKTAQRKLLQLDEALVLTDLYHPPSNRLEALSGQLKGFYSLRINERWRIVFEFSEGVASEVSVTDHYK